MPRRKVQGPKSIVEAAMQLFEKNGYRNTTIDDIADAAGVAKPTVYQYVRSKSSLLEQIFATVLERLDDELARIRSAPGSHEQVLLLVHGIIGAGTELQPYFRIFFGEELELPPGTRRQFRQWARRVTDEVTSVLAEAQAAGVVRSDVDPKIGAYFLIGMLTSVSRWYGPGGDLRAEDIALTALRMLTGYVSPTLAAGLALQPVADTMDPPAADRSVVPVVVGGVEPPGKGSGWLTV
jgi:TetR/AcrR family transcriptional regulator, cholesterol catabolism regulator